MTLFGAWRPIPSPSFLPTLLLILLLPLAHPIIHRSERVVKLRYGDLQGFIAQPNHRALGMVEVFLGVPYAAAPLGKLRFMPPTQPFPWSYLRRAEVMPPVCPQKLPDVSNPREALKRMPEGRFKYMERLIPMLKNQSEDCLFLNLYVPVKGPSSSSQLPVMVYIHGESYEWNSGNPYDGVTLASYGRVIVVTINFRLGVLGFLRPALSEAHVSNFGLLDQIAALHWVKENIAAFGGDPENITILGHGTGAALANLLLISPVTQVSNGLFQRAILMSGSAISKWALTWDPHRYTIQVAKALGCPLSDHGGELVSCLRSKTVDELLSVKLQTPPFTTPLGPIVDGMIIKTDPLRSMTGERTSAYGRYDLLYGVTLAESYAVLNAAEVKLGMTAERKKKLLRAYVSNNFEHHADHIFTAILNEYKTYSSAMLSDERSIRDQTLEILSDAQIVAPVVNMGNLHSDLNSRSYFYVFNHQSAYGDYPVSQGTVHGEELAYVFGAPLVGGFSHFGLNYTLEEVFLSELVMTLWTNFAKTGNPNMPTPQEFFTPGASPNWGDNLKTMWPPYEKTTQMYLHLDMQVLKNSHYRARKLGLWNRLIPDLVSSSGNIRGSISPDSFPGATMPTITFVPTKSPLMNVLFEADRTTTPRPNYYPVGPTLIKPVPTSRNKPTPYPIYPFPDDKGKVTPLPSEESIPNEEASMADASSSIVIGVEVIVFLINCIALGLIFMYYRRKKRNQRLAEAKDRESETPDVSEAPSDVHSNNTGTNDKGSERKSRRKRRSGDEDSQDCNSESVSRVSSLSRESSSSGRRKHSRSQERSITSVDTEAKSERPSVNGHKRNKSDNSLYIEIGKDESKSPEKKAHKQSRRPSVKFNTLSDFPNKDLNRSTSSIASKSSIKSTSSRASARSVASRTSAKSGSSVRDVKKNASCQSLSNSEYSSSKPNEAIADASAPDGDINSGNQEKKQAVATMQKRNFPKVLPDAPEIQTCSTLPRVRPPPPPRSTSLTARDIQELEKLQEVYRRTRPPRHASTDSCELSGSEPFYSMGGGEAPAKAPGLMYGPTLAAAASGRRSVARKSEGPEYDQYQKYTPSYQLRDPNTGETHIQLSPPKSYMTYGDNIAARGPLAAFGKMKDPAASPVDYEVTRLSSVSPISTIPPPVPAHQVPLTPSILKTPAPLTFPQNPVPADLKIKPILTSSDAMYDQTENTGTIKRQKPKNSSNAAGSGSDTLEKPLKSVLKTTSAYDKPKGGSGGDGSSNSGVEHIVPLPPTSRSGVPLSPTSLVPISPESISSVSSASPSLSSNGNGLPSPTELKGILVKRTPRTSQPSAIGSTKQRSPEENVSR